MDLEERVARLENRMAEKDTQFAVINTKLSAILWGYEFFAMEKDVEGEDSRVYRKVLSEDGPEKEARLEKGNAYKARIVEKAREGVDPVAVCGFSCNHCFLGEYCGGSTSSGGGGGRGR